MIAPNTGSENGADRQPSAALWDGSRRLWSLWDMLRIYAEKYIQLGSKIADVRERFAAMTFSIEVDGERYGDDEEELPKARSKELKDVLYDLFYICRDLPLPVSAVLVMDKINVLPESQAELDLVMQAVMTELRKELFLFVPQHAAKYYEWNGIVSDKVRTNFPSCSAEIRFAGTSFAAGLYTACVFHSMRAAEVGVRVLANALNKLDGVNIEFKSSIEFQEWGIIQDRIDDAIKTLKQQPRGHDKASDQRFYSEAAAQLRYFNDGWRVRASHAREPFTEQQALTIMDHTREFFSTIAERLSE